MSDEIRPALSPEQWADYKIVDEGGLRLLDLEAFLEEHGARGLMAIANDALRDDDPAKITADDASLAREYETRWAHDDPEAVRLRAHAAKLAALLRPRSEVADGA